MANPQNQMDWKLPLSSHRAAATKSNSLLISCGESSITEQETWPRMTSMTSGWICSQLHLLRQKPPPSQAWTNLSIGGTAGGGAAGTIANGQGGLDGKRAARIAALAKNREIVKLMALIGVAKCALVPSRSFQPAIFRIALWIASGTLGVLGAHAPRHAVVDSGFGNGVNCRSHTGMEEKYATNTKMRRAPASAIHSSVRCHALFKLGAFGVGARKPAEQA